jgi:Fe-S oxidoreductase
VFADSEFTPAMREKGKAVIHDPCPQRYESGVHGAVRDLARSCGLSIHEREYREEFTRCCGEGGLVKFVRPEFSDNWTDECINLADGQRIVTSCAGCANFLGASGKVDHVLDLMFDTKHQISFKPPFTYLVRLMLKWWFMKKIKR